ncbi:MAG: hypothetical protein JWQ77_2606 [Jatrophihabitans sp.]|nr:hypothetical protein [Jatrophihabitans sp.]
MAVVGAIVLATTSASAGTKTVDAELSLSGIATSANILGGSQIGVHPGDTVDFAPSTIPTAGLKNIPVLGAALDSLLQSVLGSATGYQITLHLPATFPGGKRNVTLGACTSTKHLAVTFPKKGDYTFTWSAVAISPLCLLPANIGSLAGNQLKNAGVALNASNQWVANIHVATNAVDGGISIQLPGVSVAPSVPVLGQLPTLGISGVNLPTIPISVPSITSGLGGGGGGGGGGSSSAPATSSSSYTYTPPATTIPQLVVPHPGVHSAAEADAGGSLDGGFGNPLPDTGVTSTAAPVNAAAPTSTPAKSTPAKTHTIEPAASNKLATAQLPVLLAILAIVALSLVTGTYARLYLMRRNGS